MSVEMTTVTVDVTQEDIDRGERGDCKSCPIARAILRAIPRLNHVRVYGSFLILAPKVGSGIALDGSGEMDAFTESFDNGDPVQPFSFPLSIPASFIDESDLAPPATEPSPL